MAIYIPIRKELEDDVVAEYSYRVSGEVGRVRIDKKTGDFWEIQALSFEDAHEYAARVIYKLRKHIQEGELPDVTSWSA